MSDNMAHRVVCFCLSFTLVAQCSALTLRQCGPDTPLVVQENTQNYEIVCENIRNDIDVKWEVTRTVSGRNDSWIGSCPTNSTTCTGSVPRIITFSRPSPYTISIATITEVKRTVFGVASVGCRGYTPGSTGSTSSTCNIDIIHGAEISSCSMWEERKDFTWNLTGNCSITKVFSSFNRYSCHLWQNKSVSNTVDGHKAQDFSDATKIISVTYSPTLDNSTPPYASGVCSYSVPLPTDNGKYYYAVRVSPGDTVKSAGNITVAQPRKAPSLNFSMSTFPFVKEHNDLTCTCTASDLGSPKGRLIGYYGGQSVNTSSFGDGFLKFGKKNLTRSDNGSAVKCILDWATQDTDDMSTSFTVQIAYGPDTVIISGPQVFDINPVQAQNIDLSCSGSSFNPYVNYTWTGCANGGSKTDTCSFLPSQNVGSYSVQCIVSNPLSQVTRTANHTVELNYLPDQPPVISVEPSFQSSQPNYKGDNLTLTCTVHGGKPVSAAKINFTCPGMGDMSDVISASEVRNSLRFFPVTADNHGNCTCGATWKNTTWYNKTSEWSLIVYTPPSPPNISLTTGSGGPRLFDFLEGTNVSLKCHSDQAGRPEAHYTWPESAGGRPVGDLLVFDRLTRAHNGGRVTCSANNDYTAIRQPVADAVVAIQVYYYPVISFTQEGHLCETLEYSTNHCIITEGQNVTFRCEADSNPSPGSIKWSSQTTEISVNATLVFTAVNRTLHNSRYNCTVNTSTVSGDTRLPLTSSVLLTVIVKYSPSILSFHLNAADNQTVTLNENDNVTMLCQADGRPTPYMQLFSAMNNSVLVHQPQGLLNNSKEITSLNYTVHGVQCEASGDYRCDVDNGVGHNTQSIKLLVMCGPKRVSNTPSPGDLPFVNVGDKEKNFIFELTAYPVPHVADKMYLGLSGNETKPVMRDIIEANCVSKDFAPASVICNITVSNLISADIGFYSVTFSNGLGQQSFIFELRGELSNFVKNPDVATIVGVICAIVLVAAIVILVIFVWRRHRGQNLNQRPVNKKDTETDTTGMITNEMYHNAEEKDDDYMIENSLYAGSEGLGFRNSKTSHPTQGVYEDVCDEASSSEQKIVSLKTGNDGNSGNSSAGKETPSDQESADSMSHGTYSFAQKLPKNQVRSKDKAQGLQESQTNKPAKVLPPVKPKPDLKQKVSSSEQRAVKSSNPKGKDTKAEKNGRGKTKKKTKAATPLSMHPHEKSSYENFAFETPEQDQVKDSGNLKQEKPAREELHNKDGLIYVSLAFDETKSKKPPPPRHEKTEYVSIDLQKTASQQTKADGK